jgi:Zn-dependent protease
LNPLKHIDPIGSVLLPLLLLFLRAPFVFGWAKPVPINVLQLRRPKRDILWVGAAGPAANFSLAALTALLLKALGPSFDIPLVVALGRALVFMNLVLGTFNLLPIPPLDGSRVLTGLLPISLAKSMLSLERWGMVLIMVLLSFGILGRVLWPVVTLLARGLGL